MKSAVALWGGALSVTVVAPTIFFWLAARPPAVNPEALVPVATPPGITLQVHASEAHGRSAAVSEVVYADALGMTLYTYDKEVQNGKLACAGECAGVWQPALAPPTAVQAGPWSLIKREDGTKQWTFRGAPLYRFRQERAIGEAAGDNAEAGAWHAAAFRPEAGMILPEEITVRDIVNAGGAGLVDYMGRTIYAFDGDPLRPIPQWLPLEAPEIANPTGQFSVIARDDGITQWAYRGKALYNFDGDQKPGDANGAGGDEVVNHHCFTLLSVAVYTANTLLDAHRGPWQVIVHHAVTELKVETFATYFG